MASITEAEGFGYSGVVTRTKKKAQLKIQLKIFGVTFG
jgi:hypothetical protein